MKFTATVAVLTGPDHLSIQDVERGKTRRRPVALCNRGFAAQANRP